MMRNNPQETGKTTRRRFVAGAAAGALAAPVLLRGGVAWASPEELAAAIRTITKGAEPKEGRVKVDAPALAETGNAVQVTVSVESPMNERDRVAAIHILVEKNPEAETATFRFGRAAGKAAVTTRLRMFAPQRVVGLAELGDGSFWIGSAHVEVTLAACVDPDVK